MLRPIADEPLRIVTHYKYQTHQQRAGMSGNDTGGLPLNGSFKGYTGRYFANAFTATPDAIYIHDERDRKIEMIIPLRLVIASKKSSKLSSSNHIDNSAAIRLATIHRRL